MWGSGFRVQGLGFRTDDDAEGLGARESHVEAPRVVQKAHRGVLQRNKLTSTQATVDEHLTTPECWRGELIQKCGRTRFPLLKTTALREKLTFGDPFKDSGVVRTYLDKPWESQGLSWQISSLTLVDSPTLS